MLIGLLLAVILIVQINQPFPEMAWMQHLPTMLLIIFSPLLLRRWPINDAALAFIILFLILHSIGGRYAYSNVPYNRWSQDIFGFHLNEIMGWTRNHYDRLVHYFFGFCALLPFAQLSKSAGHSASFSVKLAIGFVLAASCIYEIFEWLLTIFMAGETAARYNGQQGDIWDAQKDMALAAIGAMTLYWPVKKWIDH
ncbi:hypothetical protein LPB140_08220 [Sphingorhabdus lutea]|uniref:DUF2238 domain-containing protein n=1 Tax=Sphingorhabdus lutea TaxID=1913578 RepID=A0A1L3JF17_9SPHN|nr:hypothetical protein LPB140_08220 [Sphingorhabdus lutea]